MDASAGARGFADVVLLGRVDSTNRWVVDAARDGAAEGLVAVADEQTAGRGRRGRSWASPAGSALLCSVLFRPRLEVASLHLVPSIVALASLDAGAAAGVALSIKWPNDLLAGEAKVGGILAEIVTRPADELQARDGRIWPAIVVGIGLNLDWPPGWSPPATTGPLAGLGAPATTVAAVAGRAVDRDELLDAFLRALDRRWARGAPRGAPGPGAANEVMAAYREHCATIGARVRVERANDLLEGTATGIDDDGRLLLETDAGTVALDAADVVHLRRTGPGHATGGSGPITL